MASALFAGPHTTVGWTCREIRGETLLVGWVGLLVALLLLLPVLFQGLRSWGLLFLLTLYYRFNQSDVFLA